MTSATSHAALLSIEATALEEKVAEAIRSYGRTGCISDELLVHFAELSYSSVTARFSSLERKGIVVRLGDTRKGVSGRQQQVMRHVDHSDELVEPAPTKKKRNPFMAGVMYAAKLILESPDLPAAKAALGVELRKLRSKYES